jgi:glutathione S-transferase
MMKLFVDSNYLSPYAMSAFVTLREKRVRFEIGTVDIDHAQHLTPAFAALSTTMRVPTLSDGAFHLSESSAICEYLEDRYPETRVYPTDLQQRAKARQVQAWLRSDLMPIRQERNTEVVFLKRSLPALSSTAQAAAAKLFAAAQMLLPARGQSLFDTWSIADTDLALMLNRLVLAGDDVPDRLANYARAQWQHPGVQEWVNLPRP